MANEAVARGSLVLSVDAQQLNAGLNKAAKDAKAKGSEVAKNFKAAANEQAGAALGGTSVLTQFAKGGAIAAGVAVVASLGKELWTLVDPARAFSKEVERNKRLGEQWLDSLRTQADRAKEALAEFSSVAATGEGLRVLRGQIGSLQRELDGATSGLVAARREAERWESIFTDNQGDVISHWIVGMRDARHQEAKRQFDELQKAYDERRKRLTELQRQERLLTNPTSNPAARTALADFIRQQQDAAVAARRLGDEMRNVGEEAQLDDLRRRFGFNEGDLAAARLALRQRQVAETAQEAGAWIRELTDDVGALAMQVRRDSDDVKLDEFVKRGADQAQLARIRQLVEWRRRLNQEYQPLQTLERGSAAEVTWQNKVRFEEQNRTAVADQLAREQVRLLARIVTGIDVLAGSPEF